MAIRVVSHVRNAVGVDLSARAALDTPIVMQSNHSLGGDRLSLLHAVAHANHLRSEEE